MLYTYIPNKAKYNKLNFPVRVIKRHLIALQVTDYVMILLDYFTQLEEAANLQFQLVNPNIFIFSGYTLCCRNDCHRYEVISNLDTRLVFYNHLFFFQVAF
ncbi:unnamed protein product, partial [Schistosoma haematobium]